MFTKLLITAVVLCGIPAVAQTTSTACSAMTLGANGALNGFVPSPADAWHQDISAAPLDPKSNTIITTTNDLGGALLHPDFSSIAGGNFGIPYTVVDSSVTPNIALPITLYPADSDITRYPIPSNMTVEGNPAACSTVGDQHAIVLDRNTCVAFEMFETSHCTSGWSAGSAALWDLTTVEKRPYGYSSVDAAGLSVFEGLVRYDEIVAGVINHALRFTALHTRNDVNLGYFTAPAIHASGSNSTTDNIMGMRIRLNANFDISKYSSTNQIILKAMKQYGMILADNGTNMYFQGTPDARWSDDDLHALTKISSSNFEVVQMGPVYDSATAPTGAKPVITSFTASQSTVPSGSSVTLTPVVTGASYSYIDNYGFVRGPVTVNPTATTTYTLTSRNAFGSTSASTTVTIGNSPSSDPSLQFAAIGAKTFGAAPFGVSAASSSTGAITYSVVSGPAVVSGATVSITGVGTVTLRASQVAAGSSTATTAQTSFVVSPASPTLAFVAIPAQTFGVAPFTVSTTTKSSGSIAYSVSGPATLSGSTLTVTGAGTVTLQATQAAAGNYTAGTATTSFTVAAKASTLAFAAIPAHTVGDAAFTVSATSASTGAITYSVVSGPATIAGQSVTVTAAGTVTLKASQVAAGNYAASTATTSFTVAAKANTLAFNAITDKVYGAPTFYISATSPSYGIITFSVLSGPATIVRNGVTVTGVGTVTLQASQVANNGYPASTITTSFNVTPEAVKLTFAAIPSQVAGAAPISVSATSVSTGPITYTVVSGPATVSGHTVTTTGAGTVALQASQAAAGNYLGATATASFSVTQQADTLTFSAVSAHTFGDAPFAISATSPSTGAITYTVSSGRATISGNMLTLTGSGLITLRASQVAAGSYTAGTATTTFTAAAAADTVAFNPIPAKVYPTPTIYVSITSPSYGLTTYSVASGPATITGNAVTVTGPGTVTLQASQVANGNYAAGTATTSFNVASN